MNEVGVAMQTGILRDLAIARLDSQRLGIVVQRERQGMKEAVIGLGDPLADWIVRQMAVVTNGNIVMARLLPCVIRLLHDMAIDTCLGIVTQVTGPFSITKCERTQPEHNPQQDREARREEPHIDASSGISLP